MCINNAKPGDLTNQSIPQQQQQHEKRGEPSRVEWQEAHAAWSTWQLRYNGLQCRICLLTF